MWLSGVPPYEALIQFDLVTGWYQGSSSIQSIDWLNRLLFTCWLCERSSSGFSNGRLVLETVLSYLPAYLPACLPACLCQCLIQFRGGVGPIEGFDWFESFSMAVCWLYIRTMVVWGASWFNLVMGLYQSSGLIQSIDWLNRLWCSLAGCLNGRHLVLATVLSYLPACLPACVCVWFNLGKGSARSKLWLIWIVLYSHSLAVHSNSGRMVAKEQ